MAPRRGFWLFSASGWSWRIRRCRERWLFVRMKGPAAVARHERGRQRVRGCGERGLRVMVGATDAATSVGRRCRRIGATALAVLAAAVTFGLVAFGSGEVLLGGRSAAAQDSQ